MIRTAALVILLITLPLALVAEDLVVAADGQAAGTGAGAAERAVEDALRNAVEKGFGVYIDAVTLAENASLISDDIIAETRGFVRSYEVLDRKEADGVCSVKVRVVISMDKVWESDSLQMLLRRMEAPRFAVLSYEEAEGQVVADNPAVQTLTEELVGRGFNLIEAAKLSGLTQDEIRRAVLDVAAAADLGRRANAELMILVKASAAFDHRSREQGVDLVFYNGLSEVRAVQVDTGRVVASSTGKSFRGARIEKDSVYDALSFAARNSSAELVKSILSAWAQYLNMGREVELIVSGLSVSDLARLTDALKSVPGVREVSQRKYAGSVAELAVKSKLKAIDLAAELERLPGAKMKVLQFTSNRIEARLNR